LVVPVIVAGTAFTVIGSEREQPVVVTVYVMVSSPAAILFTSPVTLTVAMPGWLLVHVPPGVTSLSIMFEPWHTLVGPAMPEGRAFTVMVLPIVQPVPVE